MLLVNLQRIVRSGFVNFWRSGVVSLSSVVVVTLVLFVIGGLILAQAFLNSSLTEIQNKVDISISFQPDAREAEILAIKERLEARPEVAEVLYLSREQELADFLARNKDNALIVQSVEEVGNPLGARLNIRATDPSHYEAIATFFAADPSLESGGTSLIYQINFKKDNIQKLVEIIEATRNVSLAIALVLIVISIIVTYTTIALTIYISREEIAVMRLVGAGRNYVRGPFVVEGILVGAIGSLLAVFLLYPATLWLQQATVAVYGGINLLAYYYTHFLVILLILLVSGVGLGMLASFLAARRHLNI